jgi:hypothetical protein
MSSYYEALPIFRAAMDIVVCIDVAVQRFPKEHRYLRDQVAQLARGITPESSPKRAVLLVQIGKFAELPFGGARFGLHPRRPEHTQKHHRRGARYGVLWRYAHRLIERVLGAGHPVAVALEEPELAGQVKRRRLAYLLEPIAPVCPNRERTPL